MSKKESGNTNHINGVERKEKVVESLQDKIGASPEQIRKAIEKIGFDRIRVEQYLMKNMNS